jgi:Uma2 family endonuclease
MPMSVSALRKPEDRFTWQDYQTWPDSERWEIIDGIAYAMSPAPSTRHQTVAVNLLVKFSQACAGKPCKPFVAPTEVKLSDQDVVQPDILVVCDPTKITPSHIEGAPDLVVEILNPDSAAKDLREKKALYERAGVQEYMVVAPQSHYAIRFLNGADGFDKGTVFGPDQVLTVATLEGVEMPLWEVFEMAGPAAENQAAILSQ